MSVSWTLYDTGSHGTWLCYFINNHPEHAKANLNITLHPKNLQDNVDDVLTTGRSFEYFLDQYFRNRHPTPYMGWVVFARNQPPKWVKALFQMPF